MLLDFGKMQMRTIVYHKLLGVDDNKIGHFGKDVKKKELLNLLMRIQINTAILILKYRIFTKYVVVI